MVANLIKNYFLFQTTPFIFPSIFRGQSLDFRDKIKLKIEYVDEIGRAKTEKEAFRDLSHRFHGKGSGKMKQEKRAKRLQEVIFDFNLIIKKLKLYF